MFIYFIKTAATHATPEVTANVPWAFESNGTMGAQVPSGPFGAGLVCGRKSIPNNLLTFGRDPDAWTKIPGREAWVRQVGEPTHDGLKRADDKLLDGYMVEFHDGKKWLVPRVLSWMAVDSAMCTLPLVAKLNDEGKWFPGDVIPQYKPLWEAFRFMESCQQDELYEAQLNACVAAMRTHYFVDAIECSLMELFSKQTISTIWAAATDQIRFDELKKNAECTGSNSDSGS